MKVLLTASLWLLSLCSILTVQEFDIFYLSVGTAHYVQDKEKIAAGFEPFTDVSGARRSARYMHELLSTKANGQGKMLRSEAGDPLTKKEILDGVREIITLIQESESKNPLFVFYYCGHGVSEGIAWSQFLVPGDFTEKPKNLSSDPIAIDFYELSETLIYLGEITDMLSEAGIPYLCLIDACYEAAEEKFSSLENIMTSDAIESFRDIANVLRYMNEYHTENPVVFATKPGTTVKTVEDPGIPEGVKIGPLARKMLLITQRLEQLETLTLMDVVVMLTSEELDPLSKQVISNYEFGDNAFTTIFKE